MGVNYRLYTVVSLLYIYWYVLMLVRGAIGSWSSYMYMASAYHTLVHWIHKILLLHVPHVVRLGAGVVYENSSWGCLYVRD